MIFGLRNTRGSADLFTITILKTMKRWKISSNFWVEVHAGYNWSLHDHQPKNHEKWKISNRFLGWGTRGGQLIPSRSPALKTMKNEKFQMIFGLRYTLGNSWSLHDHHPENNKRWKISHNFWVEVHAGYNWSLHDHQPKNHEKWKISDYFWVEVHAGDSWSLHHHQPKNHEKWKVSNDFWVEVHAEEQLIPSRSPSLNTMKNEKFQTIFGLWYTRGTAKPFTITILKNHERIKNFTWFLSWGNTQGYNWSLHDHQPKNHEKMKNFRWFLGWGTRGKQLIPSRSPA